MLFQFLFSTEYNFLNNIFFFWKTKLQKHNTVYIIIFAPCYFRYCLLAIGFVPSRNLPKGVFKQR